MKRDKDFFYMYILKTELKKNSSKTSRLFFYDTK